MRLRYSITLLLAASLILLSCAPEPASSPPSPVSPETPVQPTSPSTSEPVKQIDVPATVTLPAPPPEPSPTHIVQPTPPLPPRPVNTAIPLMDMTAADSYKGEDGGLYGGGLNTPPIRHREGALKALGEIQPLDASGSPSPTGKIVLISLGMSNATQEFSAFKKAADTDIDKSSYLRIVDGAQGGQTATIWATKEDPWRVLEQRLSTAGVTPQQVQVVWAKHANAQPRNAFPSEAKALQEQLGIIMRRIKERYPNVKVVYLASRTYGGYATTTLNPEPHAYEGAFAVRWLIQSQINGIADLNYEPNAGPVLSPVLLWGPYLWADGANSRSDGLMWEQNDFVETDRTHPSDSGRVKVAELLLDFFKTNELARSWFRNP